MVLKAGLSLIGAGRSLYVNMCSVKGQMRKDPKEGPRVDECERGAKEGQQDLNAALRKDKRGVDDEKAGGAEERKRSGGRGQKGKRTRAVTRDGRGKGGTGTVQAGRGWRAEAGGEGPERRAINSSRHQSPSRRFRTRCYLRQKRGFPRGRSARHPRCCSLSHGRTWMPRRCARFRCRCGRRT